MIKTALSILIGLLLLPTLSLAADYKAGKHYVVLPQAVRTSDPNKIEVVELFWYGCVHCFKFEKTITAWEKALAADVAFVRTPAAWRDVMTLHARAFYTVESLGLSATKAAKLHHDMFTALNVERKKLATQEEIAEIFVKNQISKKQFDEVFSSFGVENAVRMADARKRGYKMSGTPEIVVNGKYRISGSMAGSQADMLKVADYLIGLERASLEVKTANKK